MTISITLNEGGSGVASVSLTDHNDASLSIGDVSGACWQLMDVSGNIINNRSYALSTLTALEWPLTAADLAIAGVLTIAFKAVYSSIIGGVFVSGLVINVEDRFTVNNLKSFPIP